MWVYTCTAILCPGREQEWTHGLAGNWRACCGEGQPVPLALTVGPAGLGPGVARAPGLFAREAGN